MASPTDSIEREVKLATDLAFELPDLHRVVGRIVRKPGQELRTAYFDTDDYRLWRRGITLRHRLGEDPWGAGVWTVKLPTSSPGPTLDRTELSWPGGRDGFPVEATSILRGLVRRASLAQITELVTIRRRLVLHDPKGVSCGELDDDTVTVVGGANDGLIFRQLELELDPAGEGILDGVLSALRRAGAHPGDEQKLAKALGFPSESSPSTPQTESRDSLSPRSSLGDLVHATVATGTARLLDHDYRLRLDLSNPRPHDIHQARVTSRRLRSDLKTFRSVLEPAWLDLTRSELAWLGEALGRVRDADVLSPLLSEDDGPHSATEAAGRTGLSLRLTEQRRAAVAELSAVLSGDRYLKLLDRLDAATGPPPSNGPARPWAISPLVAHPADRASRHLPAMVGHQWRVLRRRVRRAGNRPTDPELHRIRIGAKQLRYAAEMAAPVIGRPARRTAKAAERLQTVLGEHHDAVAAATWLDDEAPHVSPTAAYWAGRLSATQSDRQRTLRGRWPSVWKDLKSKKLRRWLR
jgi:CHAD domain-containing protein